MIQSLYRRRLLFVDSISAVLHLDHFYVFRVSFEFAANRTETDVVGTASSIIECQPFQIQMLRGVISCPDGRCKTI